MTPFLLQHFLGVLGILAHLFFPTLIVALRVSFLLLASMVEHMINNANCVYQDNKHDPFAIVNQYCKQFMLQTYLRVCNRLSRFFIA